MNKPLPHILLVEDDDNDADLTAKILVQEKLVKKVDRVCDGEEALSYLRKKNKYKQRDTDNPMVVLLDLKMPKINGLEVLEEIRKDPSLKYIPVVMLTSSQEQKDVVESYKLGINAYVVKSGDMQEFIDAIKEIGVFWSFYNEPPPGNI